MGPIENHSDEGWVMTDQEPMTRWRQTIMIGGERAMTEKKQKATTHNVKEQRSTKQQGPSLTKRDEVVKKSESERQRQSTEICVNRFTFSSKRTWDTLSNLNPQQPLKSNVQCAWAGRIGLVHQLAWVWSIVTTVSTLPLGGPIE
jgi:hypothetical protein